MQPSQSLEDLLLSVLDLLSPYLSYESFGDLKQVNKSFFEEVTHLSNIPYTWIRRIKQELDLDIVTGAKRDWKLSYKALYEVHFCLDRIIYIKEKHQEQRRGRPIMGLGQDMKEPVTRNLPTIDTFLLGGEYRYVVMQLASETNLQHLAIACIEYVKENPSQANLESLDYHIGETMLSNSVDVLKIILNSGIALPILTYIRAFETCERKYNENMINIVLLHYLKQFTRNQDVLLIEHLTRGSLGFCPQRVIKFVLSNPEIRKSVTNEKLWEILGRIKSYLIDGSFMDMLKELGYNKQN